MLSIHKRERSGAVPGRQKLTHNKRGHHPRMKSHIDDSPLPQATGTRPYGMPRFGNSSASQSTFHGRGWQPGHSHGASVQQKPVARGQQKTHAHQDFMVNFQPQYNLSQLTSDSVSHCGASPADAGQFWGPPGHQNSSQGSGSTFASARQQQYQQLRQVPASNKPLFSNRTMATQVLKARPVHLLPPLCRPRGSQGSVATKLSTRSPAFSEPRSQEGASVLNPGRTRPGGVVGGSIVTQGLRPPSVEPPSPSAIQLGSAAFEKSLQEFQERKKKAAQAAASHDVTSTTGTVGSQHSEKTKKNIQHELKRLVMQELTAVRSELEKDSTAKFRALEESHDARIRAMEKASSEQFAKFEAQMNANQSNCLGLVKEQITDKFLDLDAAVEGRIASKIEEEVAVQIGEEITTNFDSLDLEGRMNALQVCEQNVKERHEDFLTDFENAEASLKSQTKQCLEQVATGLENIHLETKSQMEVIGNFTKSQISVLRENAGSLLQAFQSAVTKPVKSLTDSFFSGDSNGMDVDVDLASGPSAKISAPKSRTISPVPSKSSKRTSPSSERGVNLRSDKRRKSAQNAAKERRTPLPSRTDDSSWSSAPHVQESPSRKVDGRTSGLVRVLDSFQKDSATSSQPKHRNVSGAVSGKENDLFRLSQGTLSSISCTQTAKTFPDNAFKGKIEAKSKSQLDSPLAVSPLLPVVEKESRKTQGRVDSTYKSAPKQGVSVSRHRRGSFDQPSSMLAKPSIPLSQNSLSTAPLQEIQMAVDHACPSPLTTASINNHLESSPREGTHRSRLITKKEKPTAKTTKRRDPSKKVSGTIKVKVPRRNKRRANYSKRASSARITSYDAMDDSDFDFSSTK